MSLDMGAMAAVSNIYRAAGSIRNHFERSVLAPHDLTWTGWVVLWVVWIWDDIEARHVAAESGISKGTLTGVASTLERRGLLTRRTHPDDARRVLISLTPTGRRLMVELFPLFNAQETHVVAPLSAREVQVLTTTAQDDHEPGAGARPVRVSPGHDRTCCLDSGDRDVLETLPGLRGSQPCRRPVTRAYVALLTHLRVVSVCREGDTSFPV